MLILEFIRVFDPYTDINITTKDNKNIYEGKIKHFLKDIDSNSIKDLEVEEVCIFHNTLYITAYK